MGAYIRYRSHIVYTQFLYFLFLGSALTKTKRKGICGPIRRKKKKETVCLWVFHSENGATRKTHRTGPQFSCATHTYPGTSKFLDLFNLCEFVPGLMCAEAQKSGPATGLILQRILGAPAQKRIKKYKELNAGAPIYSLRYNPVVLFLSTFFFMARPRSDSLEALLGEAGQRKKERKSRPYSFFYYNL